MDIQLMCNQLVATYNISQGMNPMGLSDPWDDYENKKFFTNVKM